MQNPSKRKFLAWSLAVASIVLGACSSPIAMRAEPIVLSRLQMQQSLQERLAAHWRLANWLELWVQDMQLDLVPSTQQIQLSMDVTVQESLLKSRWPVKAKVGFSPRYDAARRQFVMQQVQLLGLESSALPAAITVTTRALVSEAVSRQLEGQALYTLRTSDLDLLDRYGVQPGLVVIEPQQIRIPLVPRSSN